MSERIAKFLSSAGVASRRVAETMIEEGRVTLNNEPVTTPVTMVSKGDMVCVDGMLVDPPGRPRLYVYHKPTGVIVSSKDDKGRKTLEKALPAGMPRVVPVGRLDINSEGLLLLTTDGELAQWMMRPTGAGYKRVYKVRVYGALEDWQLGKIKRGMVVDGERYAPAQITTQGGNTRNIWYTVTLSEGKNREIRKMFGAFNIMVSRLLRLEYGPFALGDLPRGAVAEVPKRVVEKILEEMEKKPYARPTHDASQPRTVRAGEKRTEKRGDAGERPQAASDRRGRHGDVRSTRK